MTALINQLPNVTLQAAQSYAKRGWPVFPLKQNLKTPATSSGFKNATTEQTQISQWFDSGVHNLGIATGRGLAVLDIDRKGGKDGLTVIRQMEAIHGALPDTYKVSTPSGGEHWFFTYPTEFTIQSKANLFKEHGEGLDIRADGGYVVAAPSQTDSSADATGKTHSGHYVVSHRVPVAPLPDVWLELLIPKERVPVPCAQPLAVNHQLSEVQDALLHIPNDDYDLWVSIGKACYSLGNAGFTLWDTWSRNSQKYNQAEMPTKWQSFSMGATYQAAFIFDTAARYGWANPKKGNRANVAPIKPHIQIQEPSDWLAPAPLTDTSLSAPYPMDVLPDLIQKAINEVIEVVKCPPALAACSALSVMAVAGQGVANIQPHKGLKPLPLSLFILSIGESGERKTTADKHFSPILTQWESHQAEQLKPDLAKYRAELKSWQRQLSGTEKAIEKAAEKGEDTYHLTAKLAELEQSEPEKVLAPCLVLEDTTAQATAYDLAHSWPSAGILSDEAGVVFGGHAMKADNITHNLAMLNKLWDGSSQKINRRGEGGSFKVEHCRLSLVLRFVDSTECHTSFLC